MGKEKFLLSGVEFDPNVRRLGFAELQQKQNDLLYYLCKNRDQWSSKEDLLNNVWSGSVVSDTTVNSAISSLRKTLALEGIGVVRQ